MGCAWRRARHKRHYGQCIDIAFAPQYSRAQPAQSLPTRCAGQRGGTMAIRCRSQCQAPQRERQAVNKFNARIIQRTAKAKEASPLPLPRSRSRDSQWQQIETNASATTAQPTTIPSSGWESNEVRGRRRTRLSREKPRARYPHSRSGYEKRAAVLFAGGNAEVACGAD
jgi:hypothetical protein